MVNRNAFRISLFNVAFIAALLLNAPQSHAAMQTFEKEYTYTASELDSKSSCRAIALEQVKRILLQELGVYVESVFNDKAVSDGKSPDEVRREITTLSAGVASTEVVEEKWDGTTYWLKARIKADPDDVAKKIEALRQDKQKVAELEESRKRAEELSQELERMRNELDATQSALAKAEDAKRYSDTTQHLSAEDWFNKGYAFDEAYQHEKAVEAYSKAIELEPKLADAYYNRGLVYANSYNAKQAIRDFSKAIELNPSHAAAYLGRGNTFDNLGDQKQAIKNYSKAIELDPNYRVAYIKRGMAYMILGLNQQSKQEIEKDCPTPCLPLALLDDYRQAIKDCRKAIELTSEDVAGDYRDGEESYSSFGDAYDICEKAALHDPKYWSNPHHQLRQPPARD